MSQGEEVRGTRVKKKVKRWSTEEMIDKPHSLIEEDTEEMMKWRGINQEKMDQCCKKLAEKMGEEVLDK